MPCADSSSTQLAESDIDFNAPIGKGSLGVVYRLKNSDQYVVKEIRTDGASAETMEHLNQIIPILSKLNDPNVLSYKRIYTNEDLMYIKMQYCKESLNNLIKSITHKQVIIEEDEVLDIGQQITNGLMYLHSPVKMDVSNTPLPPLFCYDLKPTNIFLNNNKCFVISDYGIPKDGLSSSSKYSMYIAPEIHANKQYGPKSDIWSLGVILYELLVGCKPTFLKNINSKTVCLEDWKPDLSAIKSEPIRNILSKIFAWNPDDRPSATELNKKIKEVRNNLTVSIMKYRKIEEKCRQLEADVQNLKGELAAKDAEIERLKKSRPAPNVRSPAPSSRPQPGVMSHAATNLIAAVQENNVSKVKSLVADGKDLRKQDSDGMTALMYAARQGSADLAGLLLDESRMKDNMKRVALMYAAENGYDEIVKILANKEAASKDVDGKSALIFAAERGHVSVVSTLLPFEHTVKDSKGWTALMYAAKNGHLEAVRILAEKQKGKVNNDKQTALSIVQRDMSVPNRSAIIEILSRYQQEKQ